MPSSRAFCADVSLEHAEPLAATASRVDHWLLVEYRGRWGRDALAGSGLSDEVKAHLRRQAAARPRTKLLLVRRAHRRREPGLAVLWGSSKERGATLYRAELGSYEELLGLDLTADGADGGQGENRRAELRHEPPPAPDELRSKSSKRPERRPRDEAARRGSGAAAAIGGQLAHPLLLVCTHGKHDRCCARYGRPLARALEELAEQGWVWQSSHLGGDRFAGNVVVLPEGLYYGRVQAADARTLLDEHLAGRIDLPHYRGRSCYSFAVQAAERAVREETGLVGIDDLELAGVHERTVRFRAAGRVYEVETSEAAGPPAYLTCGAETVRRPRRYAARILRESAA